MSLANEIRSKKTTPEATYPQKGYLIGLTGLKFWQTETMPPPSIEQASLLIEACKNYIETGEGGPELVEAIQIWFPAFSDISEIRQRKRFGGRKKRDNNDDQTDEKPKPEPEKTAKPKKEHGPASEEKQPKTPPEPEKKPEKPEEKKPKKPAATKKVHGVDFIEKLIEAGNQNIWMVGPAGCGKTTIAEEAGKKMDLPVTLISCGAGTSATTFLGYKYPEREETPFVSAFSQPGIIVLDEFTSLEAQVAQIANSALSNNQLSATTGTFKRNPDCIIIATSNTFGHGADRVYVSNNQLDASTNDRFVGAKVEIDYSREYESQYDTEVCQYVWRLRDIIQKNGLRKIASTRAIIAGEKNKKAGLPWKDLLITDWSPDEKALV
jgi:hypothetical protein